MRHDDPSSGSRPSALSEPRPQSPAHALAWVWPLATGTLMVLTGYAVACTVSAWLVPPYLILMSLILFAPGRHESAAPDKGSGPSRAPAEPGLADESEPLVAPRPEVQAVAEAAGDGGSSDGRTSISESLAVAETARRGKGRGRKAKARAGATPPEAQARPADPLEVTWVRIGPGKFVRSDLATPADEVQAPTATVVEIPNVSPTEPDGLTEAAVVEVLESQHGESSDHRDEEVATPLLALDERDRAVCANGESVEDGAECPVAATWSNEVESGPDATEGDNGIAPDAPGPSWSAGFEFVALAVGDPGRTGPFEAPDLDSLAVREGAVSVVFRRPENSPRIPAGPSLAVGHAASSRRGRPVRGGRLRRTSPGFRHRSRRSGPIRRAFPPRSPPDPAFRIGTPRRGGAVFGR